VAILTVLLDASAPEVTLVNRFWKTVIAGTAVGAVIGVYLYAKSKEDRKRLMAEDSRAQEMASKMALRIRRTTNRFANEIGKEVARAGRSIKTLGNRLSMGGVD
jgi:hypothetical protein